jgi:hypothetical protein
MAKPFMSEKEINDYMTTFFPTASGMEVMMLSVSLLQLEELKAIRRFTETLASTVDSVGMPTVTVQVLS